MNPSAKRGSGRMPIAEIDPDNPPRPEFNICFGIELAHQTVEREREHARDAELRDAVNACLALVRQIILFELRAPLGADVFGLLGVDARIGTVRAILMSNSGIAVVIEDISKNADNFRLVQPISCKLRASDLLLLVMWINRKRSC
jgi:hypothetical protein